MKTCSKCKIEKEELEFNRDKNRKDGLYPQCRECQKVKTEPGKKARIKKEKRELAKQELKRCSKCKGVVKISDFNKSSSTSDGLYPQCKNCQRQTGKESFERNKDKKLSKNRNHYWKNREQYSIRRKMYYEENKEEILDRNECWRINNPEKANFHGAKYRAAKLQRTPKWLTEEHWELIKMYYEFCPPGFEVDHIIPIHGEAVSGLHVPWNLRLLDAGKNASKANKIISEIDL